jgi:hypothetical protein
MAISRPRKSNYLDKLFSSLLDVSVQLQQARTKEERDFFSNEIRDLEMRKQEYLAKLTKRHRAREATARRKRLNLPRWE